MKKTVAVGETVFRLSPPSFLCFSKAIHFSVSPVAEGSNVVASPGNYGIRADGMTEMCKRGATHKSNTIDCTIFISFVGSPPLPNHLRS